MGTAGLLTDNELADRQADAWNDKILDARLNAMSDKQIIEQAAQNFISTLQANPAQMFDHEDNHSEIGIDLIYSEWEQRNNLWKAVAFAEAHGCEDAKYLYTFLKEEFKSYYGKHAVRAVRG